MNSGCDVFCASTAHVTRGNGQRGGECLSHALAALLFLYRELLERNLDLEGVVRARKRRRLSVVLSEAEVRTARSLLSGDAALVVRLLYGSGLRLTEALRTRVLDLDFDRGELMVRNGKGGKDRRAVPRQ